MQLPFSFSFFLRWISPFPSISSPPSRPCFLLSSPPSCQPPLLLLPKSRQASPPMPHLHLQKNRGASTKLPPHSPWCPAPPRSPASELHAAGRSPPPTAASRPPLTQPPSLGAPRRCQESPAALESNPRQPEPPRLEALSRRKLVAVASFFRSQIRVVAGGSQRLLPRADRGGLGRPDL